MAAAQKVAEPELIEFDKPVTVPFQDGSVNWYACDHSVRIAEIAAAAAAAGYDLVGEPQLVGVEPDEERPDLNTTLIFRVQCTER